MLWEAHTVQHHEGLVRSDTTKRTMQVLATYREENKRLKESNVDLLEALQTVQRDWLSSFDSIRFAAVAQMDAAIAKATGTES